MNLKHVTALTDLLNQQVHTYNNKSFIENDPISIPHLFSKKFDIEISALFAATLSWGNRRAILKSCNLLMQQMDFDPYQFVMHANDFELKHISHFVYRTFNAHDCKSFVMSLRQTYQQKGLQSLFAYSTSNTIYKHVAYQHPLAIMIFNFRQNFIQSFTHQRTAKHIGNPYNNSTAKRICMFLRWMVRNDKYGVDFGLWNHISKADLICPLDVHSGRVARQLGLLQRQQNDWKAAVELTENLKLINPTDPVIFDFALFGMGVNNKIKSV